MRLKRRLIIIVSLFLGTLTAGTLGYRIIEGWPFIDSLYMAVITVTTVGFSEVHPLSDAGRVFTAFLILLGVGTITYSFGALTNYIIAGELRGFLGERKMKRLIASMKNHMLICGYGRMGHEVCLELLREGRTFVVIDEKEESIRQARDDGYTAFHGDPGLDETLKECGIDRAMGLAAVSDNDAKNLMVVISARGLKKDLLITARVSAEDAPEKFIRAGANSVFLPYRTGGRRIGQMMMRPAVVGFLEDILHDESSLGMLIEDLQVENGSEIAGMTLRESGIRERTGVYVLGVQRQDTGIVADLTPSTVIHPGDTLIVLGQRHQLDELELYLLSQE